MLKVGKYLWKIIIISDKKQFYDFEQIECDSFYKINVIIWNMTFQHEYIHLYKNYADPKITVLIVLGSQGMGCNLSCNYFYINSDISKVWKIIHVLHCFY